MANAGLMPDEEGEKTMGATGLFPGFTCLPIDPIRAWLNRYLSFADMMRFVEWQEIRKVT